MTPKQKTDTLNFALIGCGRIAQSHLEAISSLPACCLKGIVDVRKQVAQSVAEQYRCKHYSDYHKLLNPKDLDAVVICTPPNTHAEITGFFLDHGIHVLCEKPFALHSKEATQMEKTARDKGCVLMMASKFRYVEDVIKAKGIIDSGILGDIVLFENVFCGKVDMRDRWNAQKDVSGGGVLIDNGCHSVDIARYLLGPISKIQAENGKRVQKLDVEDTCRLYFRTESDVMGAIDLSWSIQKEKESYIDVYGTEGVLSIGWKTSKYRQSEQMNWVDFGSGYNKLNAFKGQTNNFVGSIKGTEMPLITPHDGVESVKVIEAAYKSANMNKWVKV